MAGRWPDRLWIVRHGISAGNLARDAAYAAGAERIMLTARDVDVPLSDQGEEQARALGRWFAGGGAGAGLSAGRPDVLLVSPYLRARDTARLFGEEGGCDPDAMFCHDERLREKEFGVLDGLTARGMRTAEPQQAMLRESLGKFYHRPPGGESWCDVILRLRALMDTVALHHAGRRVMIVAHQVVVLCLRYIIEGLGEEDILAIDRTGAVANCSVTEYRFDPGLGKDGGLALARYNDVAPVAAVAVTAEPDRAAARR